MHKRSVVIGLVLFLTACGAPPPAPESTNAASSSEASVNLNKDGVIYTDYSDRLIGRGQSSVLFFFKPSDPFSVRSEAVIQSVYGTGAAVVTTYRLHYPTATGARLKYGVLVEDTFVLLDAQGQRVSNFIHPTPDEIRIILRGNIPVPSTQ